MAQTFPVNEIKDWIFDLDNTIYPARSNLFVRVAVRITEFVATHFKVPHDEARIIQKDLFQRYGTTMRGLMVEQGLAPEDYLHFVHDIDVSDLPHEVELDTMLSRLPGRKHIFTNGTVPHAENILNAYGIRHHFDHIFDIIGADYVPKPEAHAFDKFIQTTGIDPSGAVMIEDMARNLEPAAALGMRTVWLTSDYEWAAKGANEDYVHFVGDDLKSFLAPLIDQTAKI
ncbi:pyrimidine 5'-nucleotidase [Alphaproteobacteria bacterium]|jgi:putative hydrolase of the HAD superfamily|nr:pyrimidine 5'-nucleotidase [Alphaproteobacteria bacterium]